MFLENVSSENKKILILFALTILFSMLVNVFHPYLWGPDEPRVAQIARETFISGNYVTPHLCCRPFVEKPPLYFDMLACSYVLTGGTTAGVARLVSALLGCVMLAAAFGVGYCWGGLRRGAFTVILLITMPQFYRAAHWIAVDISVGAFCTLAFGLFMYYVYWARDKNAKWPLYLFYLTAAGAFLCKGLIGIFHIGLVIGVFILLRRRWDLLKRMLSPLAMLMFFIPVGIWIYLFYREGGIYFLHEHFINNTIGRFLHIQFKMEGSQLAFTDVGGESPWSFYLQRMPVMFGGVIALLAFIIWEGLRKLNVLPAKWIVYSDDFKKRVKSWKGIVVWFLLQLLNGKKEDELDVKQKEIVLILLLWAFLPIFVLSFSSIKEVSYILPSYVAIAILSATWLDRRISMPDTIFKGILCFAVIVIPVGIASFLFAPAFTIGYIISVSIWIGLCIPFVIADFFKMRLSRATFIICAMILCGIIMGNTPEVMRKTGLNKKCYIDIAKHIFDKVGDKTLYIYGGCETLRGSIPFYGKRHVPVILGPGVLQKVLSSGKGNFVIVVERYLKEMRKDKELSHILKSCKVKPLPFANLNEDYILISAPAGATRKK